MVTVVRLWKNIYFFIAVAESVGKQDYADVGDVLNYRTC